MDREILFRGKRTDNGEWVEGWVTSQFKKHTEGELLTRIQSNVFGGGEHLVDNETVGEYTGLTDKNGKKIFEGDIVKGDRKYFTYTHLYGRVVYDGGQFLIAFDDALEDIECLGAWANVVEVIGNIHDNKGLLEVSE